MKYNILFISHERKMGGANFALIELVKNLRDAGNNVFVVVLFHGCPIDIELKKIGIRTFSCFFGWWQQPEYWSKPLKIFFRFLHWLQWISIWRISRFVKKNDIHIIHSNSSVIDIGAQVARKTHCCHVWHFREFGKADYRLEYIYPREQIIEYISKQSDMVVFISNALQRSYIDLAGKSYNNVVYDGIASKTQRPQLELIEYKIQLLTNRKRPFHFLVSGNISPGKNQKLVLEAVDYMIHEMLIDEKLFQLHFAGAETALRESRRYGTDLRNYVRQHNISNVVFHGFVNNMDELRNGIDGEIIPSVSEAYGRVTLEAMMVGNLVIASNSGSNPELLENGRNGLLFECNNAKDLAYKMRYAMEHSCSECRKHAFQYVYAVHTREEAAYKVQVIYNQIWNRDGESEKTLDNFDNI